MKALHQGLVNKPRWMECRSPKLTKAKPPSLSVGIAHHFDTTSQSLAAFSIGRRLEERYSCACALDRAECVASGMLPLRRWHKPSTSGAERLANLALVAEKAKPSGSYGPPGLKICTPIDLADGFADASQDSIRTKKFCTAIAKLFGVEIQDRISRAKAR